MMPGDPVIGGVVLRRPAEQSPNFVTGVSGWTINADGSAEFNNLSIRGTFNGTDFIINSSGMFFYSGIPALGNLILSVVPGTTSVTDPEGNTAQPGVTVGLASSTQIQLLSNGGVGQLLFRLNSTSFTNPVVEGAIGGSFAQLVINGPATTVAGFKDFVGIEMNSSDGVSSQANMEFIYTNTSGAASVIGSWNGSGWTLGATSVTNLAISGAVTSDLHVDGTVFGTGGTLTVGDAVQLDNNLTVTGNISAPTATIDVHSGNVNLNMASPPNYPTAGKTLAQTQACLDGLIGSMINRQLVA